MSEYDDLLAEANTKAEAFRATAKDYISRMYAALRNENLLPADARDRIKKDCINIWSRRTILDAMPDEAKDPEKQKAGRLAQKKHNSAAFSAAQFMKKQIVVNTSGHPLNEQDDACPAEEHTDQSHNAAISGRSSINFELSLPFEELHLHMQSIFNETGVHGNVWIHGTLDLRTGKVSYVSMGRIITDAFDGNNQGAS